MKSVAHRLAGLEAKVRKTLWPLVLFYRESEGLSLEQEQRIADARAKGRPVKIIKTFVVNNE